MCLVSVSGKSALFRGEILGWGSLLGEGKLWLGLDVMYESRMKKPMVRTCKSGNCLIFYTLIFMYVVIEFFT